MKVFDSDNNAMVSKQEAYDALLGALSKFGGLSGIAKMAGFGKTSSGLPHDPHDPNIQVDN
jgi:DNA-binding phage protein